MPGIRSGRIASTCSRGCIPRRQARRNVWLNRCCLGKGLVLSSFVIQHAVSFLVMLHLKSFCKILFFRFESQRRVSARCRDCETPGCSGTQRWSVPGRRQQPPSAQFRCNKQSLSNFTTEHFNRGATSLRIAERTEAAATGVGASYCST